MAETSPNKKDDVISLEDLVGSPAPSPAPAASAAPGASAVRASASGESKAHAAPTVGDAHPAPAPPDPETLAKIGAIDHLLQTEDPAFAGAMQELHAQGLVAAADQPDIDPLDLEDIQKKTSRLSLIVDRLSGWPKFLLIVGTKGAKNALIGAKALSKKTLHGTKLAIAWFRGLNRRAKISVLAAIVLAVCSVMTFKLALHSALHPNMGPPFMRSFADIADSKYTYDTKEELDDFSDPMFHPEHVVELEHIVVNLRRRGDDNPMGLFAFYFAASSQESAVELKDREAEARDVISRTLEGQSYEDLSTIEGKERLKLILRKSLNTFLTKGQVRKVFIKNMVLKI